MYRTLSAVLMLLLAGCAGSATTTPLASTPSQGELSPQVWQRGTPPVHWEIFAVPFEQSNLGANPSYSWPLLDRSGSVAFGVTCCGDNPGEPPQAFVQALNYSGSAANPSERVNLGPATSQFDQNAVPVKIFQCAGNTQICSVGDTLMFGPNNQQYYIGYGFRDATAGSGNTVWATTTSSFIVSGNNGVTRRYSFPASRDHAQAIAMTRDGSIWITLQDTSGTWRLAKLSPGASTFNVFGAALPASPPQLLVGPDGNIWFAIGTTLYRVQASTAQLSRFTLPQRSNGYLTTGPDNTVWSGYYAATSEGLIEVTSSGAVIGSFACPSSVCNPGPLNNEILQATQGPDGNIWFVFSRTDIRNTNETPNATSGIGIYVRQAMSVSPSAVMFSGAGRTQTITFSEANYSGAFTVTSTNTAVVRVVKMLTPHEAEIQSVGKGGARAIVRDTQDNYFGVNVTVQ